MYLSSYQNLHENTVVFSLRIERSWVVILLFNILIKTNQMLKYTFLYNLLKYHICNFDNWGLMYVMTFIKFENLRMIYCTCFHRNTMLKTLKIFIFIFHFEMNRAAKQNFD